jgi:hypothetical protein
MTSVVSRLVGQWAESGPKVLVAQWAGPDRPKIDKV